MQKSNRKADMELLEEFRIQTGADYSLLSSYTIFP